MVTLMQDIIVMFASLLMTAPYNFFTAGIILCMVIGLIYKIIDH